MHIGMQPVLYTRKDFRDRWEGNRPCHIAEFGASFVFNVRPYADEFDWVPPWVLGFYYAWDSGIAGNDWWATARDAAAWLSAREDRDEVVRALVAALELGAVEPFSLGRGAVETILVLLAGAGWPRGIRLAAALQAHSMPWSIYDGADDLVRRVP